MRKFAIILLVYLGITTFSIVYANPYFESSNYYGEAGSMWFDSLNVRFIGNWPFGSTGAVDDDSARNLVFCGSGGGVYILDVSNPFAPLKMSEKIHTRGGVRRLFYDSSSQRIYIAAGFAGLDIWDVSNPASPIKLGSCHTRYACGVYGEDSYVYIADVDSGLRVIDVSTPSNPIEVGHCDTPGYAYGVYVSGSYAYVADSDSGLRVIDVSTSTNPHEVGFCDTPGSAREVYVSGCYAYVADWDSGFCVIDISIPSNPLEVGSYNPPSNEYVTGVNVSDSYAYVTVRNIYGFSGLRIFDVSTPSNAQEVGYYETPGNPRSVYVSGSYAYVADGSCGLQIYENLLAGVESSEDKVSYTKFRLLQNPVMGDYIELELCLKEKDNAKLWLYNILGERVKTFLLNELSGKHRVRLQTKGLASGIYFLRLEEERSNQVAKVIIVR